MAEFGVGDRGATVAEIQQHLDGLGIDPGPIDGFFGQRTKQAVLQFQTRYFVTGTVGSYTRARLARALVTELERRSMHVPVPKGLAELEQTFGTIEWEEAEGGFVVITNDWADHNILSVRLPIVGKIQVHKRLAGVFRDVFAELDKQGLGDDVKQFGVWSPRHKMRDASRGLSTHSWAIACDLNWATNPVGRVGDLHPKITQTFENHGFRWGGRWRTRDDMHFQYCRDY